MLSTRNAKWLFASVLLVVVATVEAAPSIGGSDAKVVALTVSPSSYTESSAIDKVELLISTSNPALAKVGADILKPPDLTNPLALPPGTKSLPAVPAALFMSLTGFLCVTLVRDRKVWLVVVTTLLWAGQVGITILPKVTSHLIHKKHTKQSFSELTYTYKLENTDRLRCCLDGTQYIGLLHHLEGIPGRIERPHVQRGAKYLAPPFRRGFTQLPNFAIVISRTCFIPAFICLAYEVKQFVFFSPAFLLDNFPRGPPLVPRVVNFSQKGASHAAPFKLKINVI